MKSPILIPLPPHGIKGCLISRDPTSKFSLEKYNRLSGNFQFKEAPPRWLCSCIEKFIDINSEEKDKLHNFLDNHCYWTHLHKCQTDKKGIDGPRFKYPNGRSCADNWFDFEFQNYALKDKIIILLGRDLQRYFVTDGNRKKLLPDNNRVIFFPHPSRINCGCGWSWNKNKEANDENKVKIEQEIKKLLSYI